MERIVAFKAKHYVFVDENNMVYTKKVENLATQYFHCTMPGCKGRVIVVNNIIQKVNAHEDHPDQRAYISELRFRQQLREAVIRNPEVPPKTIFEQIQASLADSAHIPFKRVENLIRKTRNIQLPAIPKTLIELGNSLQTPR